MRGLIVDDELRGQRTLKSLCEEFCNELEIVGIADSVEDAKNQIASLQPDVVFLDIEMPSQNGFALLEPYTEVDCPFEVIFTTAYDEYAVKAFKYEAMDYLLKPIEIEELQTAVSKIKDKLEKDTLAAEILLKKTQDQNRPNKIALTTLDGYTFVDFDQIIRCEAEGNYTKVYLKDHSNLLITKTLKHYEGILSEHNFFRVHKSHLLNLKFVRKFIKGKQCMVETKDGEKIEVSARKREALLKKLAELN